MNRIVIEAAGITHIGAVKSINEDNYYINGKYKSDSNLSTDGIADKKLRNSYTYAVCDGMGGEGYGEFASLIAVATLEKFKGTNIRQTLGTYLKTANDFIHDLIKKNKAVTCGTTLALLNIQGNTAIAYNIGHSKVFFCRKGDLYLISKGHDDPLSHQTAAQYIGALPGETHLAAYESDEIEVKKGDTFLLCTRGVTDVLDYKEIVEYVSSEKDNVISASKKLVAAAQDGANDMTAIIVRLV